jgi:hypothetical protein
LRAALASWGDGDSVLGGVALLGVTPVGCGRPVEAVVLTPRGLVVVVGVDLPDPAIRLDAPLNATWKADSWPLVRPDGATNPGGEALRIGATVTHVLEQARVEPIPVSTVIAVGPYVSQVVQPTSDLHRGVRVLHPRPKSLLAAVRELATYDRPCSVDNARHLLSTLVGVHTAFTPHELVAEGFADAVTPTMSSAHTTFIPRITDLPDDRRERRAERTRTGGRHAGRTAPAMAGTTVAARRLWEGLLSLLRGQGRTGWTRWLPLGAVAVLAVLLLTGIIVAITSSGSSTDNTPASAPGTSTTPVADVRAGGALFSPKGSATDQDCALQSYGDMKVWLVQHPCVRLDRSLYETTPAAGSPAAVALAVVTFGNSAVAQDFGTVANTPGSGGIVDLVQADQSWPGGPRSFAGATYTASTRGAAVRITEVVWINKASTATDPELRKIAAEAASLPPTP